MASASSKNRAGLNAVYPAAVMLEPCPRCAAKPGDKCWEVYGGKVVARPNPHLRREEAAKPLVPSGPSGQ